MQVKHKAYKERSDEELMQFVNKGERMAFECLYERYFGKLVWFARQYVYDEHIAEDVTQEVFIKIIEQPLLFDQRKKFSTWAYTVVGNRCKNILRDTQNRKELLKGKDKDEGAEMHQHYDYKHLKKTISNAVDTLSVKEKTLFVLRFEHELPIKEIAEITGTPEGTIKSGIHYLLKKMSDKLRAFTHE